MAEKIGDAILELKTDSKKFDKGIKKAGKQTQKLEKKMKRAGLAAQMLKSKLLAVGAALIAGYALTKAIKGVTDLGDKIAKMSARTGVATETLSAFRLVMNLGGASIDSFAKGMKTVSKMMFDIKGGAGAEAKKAFDDIDVSIKNLDGSLRDPLEIFYEIADAFHGMEDGARKSAIAQTVLGRAGIDLIPTLNQGSDAIKKQVELAERLGYTFTKLEGQQMEEFTDAIEKMETSFKALWENAVIKLTPALTKLADNTTEGMADVNEQLEKWLENNEDLITDEFPKWVARTTTTVGFFATSLSMVVETLEDIIELQKTAIKNSPLTMTKEELLPELYKDKYPDIGGESTRARLKQGERPTLGKVDGGEAEKKIKAIGDEWEKVGKNIGINYDELGDKGVETFDRLNSAVSGWASNFSSNLNDMLWGAETTFTGMLRSFGKMITQMIIQLTIIDPILKAVMGGMGGGIDNSPMAGMTGAPTPNQVSQRKRGLFGLGFLGLAEGGIVTKPTFAAIAEREPEIVAPLSQLAGMGGSNVEVNIIGAPEGTKTEEGTTSGGMRKIDVILDEKMANNIRSGSKTFTAMTKAFSNLSPQLAGR